MKSTVRRAGAAATIAALAIAGLPWAAHAADQTDPLRLETGHIDAFNLDLNDDNTIRLNLKEDVTGSHVRHTPESVDLFVKDDALTQVPENYLPGMPASVYFLPLTQDHNLIWPGWDSQAIAPHYGADADVDITISTVDGPGDVFLWSQNSFGSPIQLVTNSWQLPGTIHQNFLAHVHANWVFTAPGVYRLTVQATVTSQDGTKTSTSNTTTYTFVVGSEAGNENPPPVGGTTVSIEGVGVHYHTGDVASLRAVQAPASVTGHHRWFTRTSADAEWTAVDGAAGDTYGFVVARQQQVKVAIYDDGETMIAESEPVEIHVDDHGAAPVIGPELETTLPETEGALIVSVTPEGRKATLSKLTLNPAADRYVSQGTITGITVTDTRQENLGWSATGRVRALATSGGGTIDGKYLGWTPAVVSATGATVTPGESVMPGFIDGTGIKNWAALGSAPAGSSIGTSVLGADLRIEAPLTTQAGTYTGLVLLAVI